MPGRNKPYRIVLGAVLAALSAAGTCSAFQQLPIGELEPVVVTASALPRRPTETPASLTVITREEIERQHANRISEVLRHVPGLHVDELGGRGGISSVYTRGGDPNFTAVMIDGIQIDDPTNPRGGSVDLSSLTPEHIERIEIVRGPMSSLYGSNAMAGAINIITRRGTPQARYGLLAEGGSFGYARAALNTGGSIEPVKYSLSLGSDRNDAQVKKDKFSRGSLGINVDLLELQNASLRLTTHYAGTATRAFPEGSGGPRFAILRETEERRTHEMASALELSHRVNANWRHELTTGLFYRRQAAESPGVQVTPDVFQIPPASFDTRYARAQLLWKHIAQLAAGWSIAGGTQFNYEEGRRDGSQRLSLLGAPRDIRSDFKKSRLTPAVIFETNVAAAQQFQITSGFRLDFPELAGTELSPKLGLLYRLDPATALRFNVGRGFKLPSFNALGDPLIGNARLKPETSVGVDFGAEHSVARDRHSVALTWFFNRFSGLVDLDPELARLGVFRLINLNTVETRGVEASLKTRPIDSVSVRGYFTWLHSDIKGTDEPLRNRPRFSGGIVLQQEITEELSVRTEVNIVGRKFDLQIPTRRNSTAGYAKGDLSVTYTPDKRWRLFGIVENFTNRSYEDYIGFRRPGLGVRVGVSYTEERP